MADVNNNMDNEDIEFFSAPLVLTPNPDDNNNDDVTVPETPMTQERDQKKELLITCNGNNCILSITECSLPCFDSHGNFYCPPCSYKSAIAELDNLQKEMLLAKENVRLAKNSLSLFINAIPQPPPRNNLNQVEAVSEECRGARDSGGGNVGSTVNVDNKKKRDGNVRAEEVGEMSDLPLSRRTRSGKAKQVECQQHKSVDPTENSDVSDEDFALLDRVFGQTSRENEKQKHSKPNSHKICGDKSDPFTIFRYQKSVVQEKDFELQDASSIEESTRSDETDPNGEKPEVVSGKSARRYKVVKRSTNPVVPDSRRKCLPWTHEEEEMIMEGVRIFSQRGKQNLPWKSILVHGAKVFHESRTPTDLKDKWKRMVKHASRVK